MCACALISSSFFPSRRQAKELPARDRWRGVLQGSAFGADRLDEGVDVLGTFDGGTVNDSRSELRVRRGEDVAKLPAEHSPGRGKTGGGLKNEL